jgi:transcriptional regulator with XRE-family HTH domain
MNPTTLNDTAAQVLSALMDLHDLTDTALGKACGKDRTWIEARRNGRTPFKLADLERLAGALDMPVTMFFEEPREVVRWSLDNPTDQGIRPTRWYVDQLALAV